MAIASLICGIVCFWGLGSIAAVILGSVALRQIRERGEGGRGLAIGGIVVGAITLVAAIVVTILLIVASGHHNNGG